jgi:DNA replication licensing factor MCM6
MDPEFSAEQIQRYIQYARTIQPRISEESAQLLVEKYCILRQSDWMGSYRMTVRQLESLIRLSEALARLHLDEEVRPRYVGEAFRLLKSSLIRVESERIDLKQEEGISEEMADNCNPVSSEDNTANNDGDNLMTIKYEDYVRMSNMLVYQLRKGDSDEDIGMKKSELMNWYLEQIEQEVDSEEELMRRRRQVKAVIERLVHKDCVLIELREADAQDPILVVHPNYQPS